MKRQNESRRHSHLNEPRYRSFLNTKLDPAQVERLFIGKLISLGPPDIQSFGAIRPDLAGEANDPIQFSCDVIVSYAAIVEEQRFSLEYLVGGQMTAEQSPPEDVVRTLSTVAELSAQIDADYTQT